MKLDSFFFSFFMCHVLLHQQPWISTLLFLVVPISSMVTLSPVSSFRSPLSVFYSLSSSRPKSLYFVCYYWILCSVLSYYVSQKFGLSISYGFISYLFLHQTIVELTRLYSKEY